MDDAPTSNPADAAAATPPADDGESRDDRSPAAATAQPKTALILLGDGLFLQPEADDDVLSVTVRDRAGLAGCLEGAVADGASLAAIHLVVRAGAVAALYDDGDGGAAAARSFAAKLRPSGALTAHLLPGGEGGGGQQQPVPAECVETIKASFVLGSLVITGETEGPDGSRTLTGQKAGAGSEKEEEE